MRFSKATPIFTGMIHLVLAAGFFFQQTWATSLWPVTDTRLSYAFIAAILAGGGAPLLWIGFSGERAALAGYGLSFGIMYAGMGISALWFYLRDQNPSLAVFALEMAVLTISGGILFIRMRHSAQGAQPTPPIVLYAFAIEVLVLAGAGILLTLNVPNTLPWNLSQESSVLYGWVFIGLAFYYLYAILNRQWVHAFGPLLGFLAYDLVLFSPLFARFGNLQPEHMRGQVAASVIIIFSGMLGIYYLFMNPTTRLWARSNK